MLLVLVRFFHFFFMILTDLCNHLSYSILHPFCESLVLDGFQINFLIYGRDKILLNLHPFVNYPFSLLSPVYAMSFDGQIHIFFNGFDSQIPLIKLLLRCLLLCFDLEHTFMQLILFRPPLSIAFTQINLNFLYGISHLR